MSDKFDIAAEKFFASDEGKKLASKKSELESIASSADGQKVKKLLSGVSLEKAMESGDMSAIKKAISAVMSTDEGARLARQISDIMK